MSTIENRTEIIPVGNVLRAIVFMGLGLVSIITGLVLTPSFSGIAEGFRVQQTASQLLDFNTFLALGEANIGAPFVNAGIMLIIVMLSYLLTGTAVNGGTIAAAFMVFGFSFAGKTLWNVWPLVLGVVAHALVNKKEIKSVMGLAWFSAALAPLVSIFTFYIRGAATNSVIGEEAIFSPVGLVIGAVVGLIAGYLVATCAGFLPSKHNGLTLYNAGFAAGLAGFLIFAVMKVIGLGHESAGPFHEFPNIANGRLAAGIAVCLIFLLICGLLITAKERGMMDAIVAQKYAGSAVEQFGFGATLVNMAVCGFACLLYWKLTITANASGVFFACLFTVVGFAANGISIRTMVPIMAGVYCTSVVLAGIKALVIGAPVVETAWAYVGSKNMLIAAIFGCGMAPVAKKHGALVAFLAGCIHSVLVPNTGGLHGWMNLYNNGFCIGLVVTFFVPMVLALLRRPAE